MAIEFHCPRCNKSFQTPDQAARMQAECPDCGMFADASTTPASASPASIAASPAPAAGWSAAGGFLIGLSVLAYVYSFCVPAFVTNEPSAPAAWGILAFVFGLVGLVEGQTTWLANPALWAGLICAACRAWKAASVFGILATCFALAALSIYEPSAAQLPQRGCMSSTPMETIRLTQLLPGYCCWLASMVLLLSGSVLMVQFSPGRRQKQRGPAQGATLRPKTVNKKTTQIMSAGQRDEVRCQSAFWGWMRATVAAALVAGLLSGLPTSVWVLVHGDGAFWGWDAALAVASQFVDRWGLQVLELPTFAMLVSGTSRRIDNQ